jgi:hypothetical protein
MTIIAVASYVAAALIIAIAFMFGVPAIFREAFQIRMVRIGGEIDGYIERGELPRHRYVDELRENAYRFAESPRNVSLKMLWMLYRSLATGDYFSPDDAMRAHFMAHSTSGDRRFVEHVEQKMRRTLLMQSFRNSVLWLPLWPAPTILWRIKQSGRRPRSERQGRALETINEVMREIVHPWTVPQKLVIG